jgi:hypothetical protein
MAGEVGRVVEEAQADASGSRAKQVVGRTKAACQP